MGLQQQPKQASKNETQTNTATKNKNDNEKKEPVKTDKFILFHLRALSSYKNFDKNENNFL